MPDALPLGPQALLLPGLEPLGVLDERGELVQPRALRVGAALQLLETARRRLQRAPGVAGLGPAEALVGADERVQELQLVGRAREPALRELSGEDEQPVGRGDEVLAGDAAAPGECPRPPVRGDAAGDDEPGLVVRAEVAKRLEPLLVEEPLRDLELGLDVRLAPRRADGGRVALRAEQQADRLRDDRLPGAGLAGDRDEAGRELEVRLADEDEVLDPQSAKHAVIVDGRPVRHTCPRRARSRSSRDSG